MEKTYKPKRIATVSEFKKGFVDVGDELFIQPKEYRGLFKSEVPCFYGHYHLMDAYACHGKAEWRKVNGTDQWVNITPHPYKHEWSKRYTTWFLERDKDYNMSCSYNIIVKKVLNFPSMRDFLLVLSFIATLITAMLIFLVWDYYMPWMGW